MTAYQDAQSTIDSAQDAKSIDYQDTQPESIDYQDAQDAHSYAEAVEYEYARFIELKARKALYTKWIGAYMWKKWELVRAQLEYQAESPPSRFVESTTEPRDTDPSSREGKIYVHDYAKGPRPRRRAANGTTSAAAAAGQT
ncbi:hypothetical protein C8Q74DRAFT_1370710 [Fomes fomentarius]|nr:hypothetical protein C8Q74DRAFT_1370710 [Fomes fomentarius]